jgi:hypothetical protein
MLQTTCHMLHATTTHAPYYRPEYVHNAANLPSQDHYSRGRQEGRNQTRRRRDSKSRSPARAPPPGYPPPSYRPRAAYTAPADSSTTAKHQSFQQGAGQTTKTLSVCAKCLGRHRHDITRCISEFTWDGERTQCHRNQNGRLINPNGSVLCSDWQHPAGCTSATHDARHECSGCGKTDHGAQQCPRAQKESSA